MEGRAVPLSELPAGLSELQDVPSELTVWGTLPPPPYVAIVGTRQPTEAAVAFVVDLAKELAALGVTVVSGGAKGIDCAAHRGALEAGGRTIAVIPGTFSAPSPRSNKAFFERIVVEGSSVVESDQYPKPHARVHSSIFFRRNALLVAMSQAVIVGQAPIKSGTRNAAAHARELGRPLLVVPSCPWVEQGAGGNQELARGAIALTSARAVLPLLRGQASTSMDRSLEPFGDERQLRLVGFETAGQTQPRPVQPRPARPGASKPAGAGDAEGPPPSRAVAPTDRDDARWSGPARAVRRAVASGVSEANAICEETSLSPSEVQMALLSLELSDEIRKDSQGRWVLDPPRRGI